MRRWCVVCVARMQEEEARGAGRGGAGRGGDGATSAEESGDGAGLIAPGAVKCAVIEICMFLSGQDFWVC